MDEGKLDLPSLLTCSVSILTLTLDKNNKRQSFKLNNQRATPSPLINSQSLLRFQLKEFALSHNIVFRTCKEGFNWNLNDSILLIVVNSRFKDIDQVGSGDDSYRLCKLSTCWCCCLGLSAIGFTPLCSLAQTCWSQRGLTWLPPGRYLNKIKRWSNVFLLFCCYEIFIEICIQQ